MCLKHDGSTAYLSYTTSAIVMVSQCYVMLNQLVTPIARGVHDFMQHDLALGGGSTLNGCLLHGRYNCPMQQGNPEGRHQQADTGNWGSMMAFPSMVQVLQTELLKKLHHKGHCDGKYDPHYHHSPLGGPHKDQQPCGRLGIGLPPQTFGSPTSTEGTISQSSR